MRKNNRNHSQQAYFVGHYTGKQIPKCTCCGILITNWNLGGSNRENGSTITGNVPCNRCVDPECPPDCLVVKEGVSL